MSASKDRLRLWLRLLKLTRSVEGQVQSNLRREFDTTLPRFDVLAALSRHEGGLKMSRLSGVLRVSNGNVTGIADRLAEEGLVERVPVPGDRRAMLLRITAAGRVEFSRQAAAHEAWVDTLLGGFSGAEARQMAAKLMDFADKQEEREKSHAQ